MLELEKNMQNLKTIDEQSNLPYKHCLNCGAELKGVYCHCCGQEAVDKTPTIRGFVMTYIDNAFLWDSQFLKTFWGLIRRPGHLTNEYLAGKFTSQDTSFFCQRSIVLKLWCLSLSKAWIRHFDRLSDLKKVQ